MPLSSVRPSSSVRLLHIEDSEDDFSLAVYTLTAAGFEVLAERVQTAQAMESLLDRKEWDIILSNDRLAEFSAAAALELIAARESEIPLILLSDSLDEERASETLKSGVSDFVLKRQINRLPAAVDRALREAASDRLIRLQTAALHAAANAMVLTDARGTIQWVNPAFTVLTGFEASEVIGNSVAVQKSGAHPDTFYRQMWETVLAGSVWQGQITNRRKDGTSYEEETTITPIRDKKGRITNFIAVKQDASQRVRAKEMLRRSEEKYRQLFEQLTDAALLIEIPGGVILECNQQAERLTGQPCSQLLSLSAAKLFPAEQENRCGGLFLDRDEPAQNDDCECEVVHTSGRKIPVAITSSPLTIGGKKMLLVLLRDITDRKAAEDELRITNDRYARQEQALIKLTGMAAHLSESEFFQQAAEITAATLGVGRVSIWQFRADKGQLTCAEMFESEDAKHSSGAVVSERDYPGYFQALRRSAVINADDAQTDQRIAEFAATHVIPQGVGAVLDAKIEMQGALRGVLCCVHFGAARRWTNDEQTFAVAVANLIALLLAQEEQKALQARFLRAQRMESIGTLAGGVAHDLNNILAPILMALPALRSDVSPQRRDEVIATIERSAERGAKIIKQVLTFGRGLSGEKHPFQIELLVKEQVKIMDETFPKNIETSYKWDRNAWAVLGDATQIHQVLLNLCVNARDAMPNGGKLSIRTSNQEIDENFASMLPDAKPGAFVLLEVSDTGTGMPPEVIDRMFEPFFTTKEINRGTGLGLSTVMGIVKDHGGFIQVESQPGRGTKFQIYLPALPQHQVTETKAESPESLHGHGELVLVVDDEHAVRQAARISLEHFKYRVLVAEDGADAVAKFTEHRDEIAAVLTDLSMPMMDGLNLARILRKLKPDLGIIASTGLGESTQIDELKTLGIETILRKPYGARVLVVAIRDAIAKRKAAAGGAG